MDNSREANAATADDLNGSVRGYKCESEAWDVSTSLMV
jgi:hypothetical protein